MSDSNTGQGNRGFKLSVNKTKLVEISTEQISPFFDSVACTHTCPTTTSKGQKTASKQMTCICITMQ